jgi:TolB protein
MKDILGFLGKGSLSVVALPSLLICSACLLAQDEFDIYRSGGAKRIPLSLEGYSGEVLSVLRFDLEIQGFEITSPDKAQYLVSGNNNSSVVGRVIDRINKASLLAKEYTGGTPRSEAHSLSDDIVEKITGRKGIARTKIAFKVETGPNSEIYVADYDGHNAIAVTADHTITRDPAWVPGRRMLYYTSYKAGNPDIYSHDLQSGTRRTFARYPGLNSGAAPSPDGRRVALVLSKGGSPDIYVCDADTSNLKQLTKTKEAESSPCWSPDGQTICFSSRAEGTSALFLVSANGGSMRRLGTAGAGNCTEPDWSPDGKTIVFTRLAGTFEICVVPASGGSVTPLVAGEDPSWAPNSRTVIFTRRVKGKRVVSLLDVPTKQTKDVQQTSGSCSQPSWAK